MQLKLDMKESYLTEKLLTNKFIIRRRITTKPKSSRDFYCLKQAIILSSEANYSAEY